MRYLAFFLIFLIPCLPARSLEGDGAAASSSSIDELKDQQLFFKEHGYLWIKDFFSSEQVALIQEYATDVCVEAKRILACNEITGKSVIASLIVVPEASNPYQVCRAEDLLSFSPEFLDFVESTITSYLGDLHDEPYALLKDKFNFKWPGGGAFPPHQDFPAFEAFGASEHVTVMIPIDPATLENGCLRVARNWRETFADDPDIDQAMLDEGHAVLPYVKGGSLHGSIQPHRSQKKNHYTE